MDTCQERGRNTTEYTKQCTETNLKNPTTTPAEIVAADTGIWDIETQIMKQKINALPQNKNQKARRKHNPHSTRPK